MTPVSSQFVNDQRLEYALYVLQQRSVTSLTDGMIPSTRRNLWKARDGKKYKTETLSGMTMSIHPHSETSGAINTLAAPYGNNIPLFQGIGAFGTRLEPSEYGAPRYTAVKIAEFTKDVVFRDLDIAPMVPSYDHGELEPKHFLPLVPIALLNPHSGIAVGFASSLLPHSLEDIVVAQIAYLKGNEDFAEPLPKFLPFDSVAEPEARTTKAGRSFTFKGVIERVNASEVRITNIPYGTTWRAVINNLDNLWDTGLIKGYVDNSTSNVDILVKFGKGEVKKSTDDDLMRLLGVVATDSENLTLIDLDQVRPIMPTLNEAIKMFTDWRLGWYKTRYEVLLDAIKIDIQRYLDVKVAIDNKVQEVASFAATRTELKTLLTELGIVNLDYIADLPVYRFTEEEYQKNEKRLADATKLRDEYQLLVDDDKARRKVYIKELQDVLTKYNKGVYDVVEES